MMDTDIDLRAYLSILLRHWKLIVGLTLIAGLGAFVVSSVQPASYQASAVVLVTQPRYQMQFDPRFETANGWQPAYRAFPTLATSDGTLLEVIAGYVPTAQAQIDNWRLSVLKKMVEAFSGGDPSLVVLRVESVSPQDAMGIANVWADVLTERGNELYGGNEQDVAFFEEQLAAAGEALDASDGALVAFEARNQSKIIAAQLESHQQAQADQLLAQRTIASIVQDIQGLRDQLAEQPSGQASSPADSLTALLLQIKAFNAQAETPIQLQIDSTEALSGKTQEEQVAFLDDLVDTLQTRSAEIDEQLVQLEPEILALQQELQETNVEHERLVRAQELARETYMTLARKLDEARIAAQEQNGTLQVGSYAAVPVEPVGPRRIFNSAVAALLGLMVGILIAFAIEFWFGQRPSDESQSE
jgi:uncharacterized protein involved in exopolysaccharide biosynthesis